MPLGPEIGCVSKKAEITSLMVHKAGVDQTTLARLHSRRFSAIARNPGSAHEGSVWAVTEKAAHLLRIQGVPQAGRLSEFVPSRYAGSDVSCIRPVALQA
jgi:hypothetical protein